MDSWKKDKLVFPLSLNSWFQIPSWYLTIGLPDYFCCSYFLLYVSVFLKKKIKDLKSSYSDFGQLFQRPPGSNCEVGRENIYNYQNTLNLVHTATVPLIHFNNSSLFLANSSFFWQMLHLYFGWREKTRRCSFEGLQLWRLTIFTLLKEPWITSMFWNILTEWFGVFLYTSICLCHYILQIFDSVRSLVRTFGKNTWQDKHKT